MQFQPAYFSAMDRGYYAPPSPYEAAASGEPNIEEPLIPLSELGETVVERDPRTGANILQTMTAAIRAGAGTVQLVMTTPPDSAIGGRAKAYGHEVREAIRELAQANEVHITGVELPTAISNLSGYNQQSGTISDEARFQALNEVRDAIKFVADVAQGGGVDIFSVEYPRTAFDAQWNEIEGYDSKGNPIFKFQMYPEEHERAVKHLVDDRNGRVIQEIRMNQEINYPVWNRHKEDKPYTDKNGHIVKKGDYIGLDGQYVTREERVPEYNSAERKFNVEKKTWHDFEEEADEINRETAKKIGKSVEDLKPEQKVTPQEAFLRASTESQERIAKGYEMYYGQMVDVHLEQRKRLQKALEIYNQLDKNLTETEKMRMMQQNHNFREAFGVLPPVMASPKELIEDELFRVNRHIEQTQATMVGQRQQAEDLKLQREHITTAEKYAKEKSIQSYAEAGLYAYDETKNNKNVKRPLYVGPEIGWPQGFGAHPDEFIELIKTAREKMAQRLVEERKLSLSAAEQAAKSHIKGLFDTSHMGMWLNNFRRVPGEPEDKRIKEFNKWYMEAVDKIAKADVIGQIQAVDSMSGAHGHLPAGQGIFPVVDAVKLFKKHGFKGPVVSEGHEEEQFGQNRILLETWKAFGAGTFRGAGGPSLPGTWRGTQFGYFGRTYPPYFVYGGYAPSNEWTLWSQTPFE